MANPTTYFGWVMPTSSSLVTNLPADFNTFGQAVDTSMSQLKGGTTGQILSKTSATDMAFTWITNDVGDITAVNTTAPLAGGGTSGALTLSVTTATTAATGVVQLSDSTSTTSSVLAATPTAVKSAYDLADAAIAKSTVTTAGDIIYRNATVPVRLGIGTAGQVLQVNSGATAPEWVSFVGCSLTNSASISIANNTDTALTFNTEAYDTDALHSTSSNTSRITIPSGKGGYYEFRWGGTWASSTAGNRRLKLRKNATTDYQASALTTDGDGLTAIANSTVVSAAAGDYFEVLAFQDSGGALDFGAAAIIQFEANKVG